MDIARSQSATDRASGPAVAAMAFWPDAPFGRGTAQPCFVILCGVGLNPTTPQNAAGIRIDPPMSVPMPIGDAWAASSPPSPPLEPPTVRVRSKGFCAVPQIALKLSGSIRHCGMFDLTNGMPPAACSIVTKTDVRSSGLNTRAANPHVESYPFMSNWSFTENGTPCNGPRSFPAFSSRSQSLASRIASSKQASAVMFSCLPTSFALQQYARTTSSEVYFLLRMASASSVAVRLTMAMPCFSSEKGPNCASGHCDSRCAFFSCARASSSAVRRRAANHRHPTRAAYSNKPAHNAAAMGSTDSERWSFVMTCFLCACSVLKVTRVCPCVLHNLCLWCLEVHCESSLRS
eukprot:gene11538-biopygen11592